MQKRYIPVENNSSLARDPSTGAIVNINSTEIAQARMRKAHRQKAKSEVEQLRDDVAQLKQMVAQLIEKK